MGKGKFIVITGPTAAGKSTIEAALFEKLPDAVRTVNFTTRPLRASETDGVNYHRVTPERFAAMLEQGEFLEWTESYGYRYGCSRTQVADLISTHRHVIVVLNPKGALEVLAKLPETLVFYLDPGSLDEIKARLHMRAADPEQLTVRLEAAARDLSMMDRFARVVRNVNGRPSDAVRDILGMITARDPD